ncbi:hypothetical protein ES703_68439 [subsurface metagenome]
MKKLFFLAVCALLFTVAMPVGALQYYCPAIPDEYVDQMSMDGDLSDWFAWIDPAFVYTYTDYGTIEWGIPPESLEDFDCTWMWGWSPKTNMWYRGVGIHDDEHIGDLSSFDEDTAPNDDCVITILGFGRYTGWVLPDGTVDYTYHVRSVLPGYDFKHLGENKFNGISIVHRADDRDIGQNKAGHYPDAWYFQEPYCYFDATLVGNDCYYELAMQLFDPWDLTGPDASTPAILSEGYIFIMPHFHDADSGINADGEDGMAVGDCFQTGVFLKGLGDDLCLYLLAPEVQAVSSSSWGAIKALFK